MTPALSRKATLFLVVTALLTAVIFVAGGALKNFIMLAPGIAALLATALTDRNWKAFGWRLPWKFVVLAWLIPILYAALAYGFIWLLGLGDVPNPLFIERAKFTLGMESNSVPLVIAAAFAYISLFMLLPATVFALGEELGWRGLLFPEMNRSMSFLKAAVFSSLVWGAWHLPGMLFDQYGAGATPFAYRLAMFLLLVVFTGTIMAWIWSRSQSIVAVAVFHASHNVVIQMFFDRITLDTEHTAYFKGEFGLGLALASLLLLTVVLVKERRKVGTATVGVNARCGT